MNLLLSLSIATSLYAGQIQDSASIVFDLNSFVSLGLKCSPLLEEKKIQIFKAQQKRDALIHSAILPKFEATGAIGPAPGYVVKENEIGQWNETYDFNTINPLWGFEIKMLQPLNFDKLRAGLAATQSNIEISTSEFQKYQIEFSQNLQQIYFKYLYARQMISIAQDVKKQLSGALEKIHGLLDNDDTSVTQDNLFEIKTYMFKVDDGLFQAENGFETAKLTTSFIFKTQPYTFEKQTLTPRNDKIPPLDSLKELLVRNNPDIKKLFAGIAGQKAVVQIAKKDMVPDLFVFASFKKACLLNKENEFKKSAELLNDPYNETVGSLGLGVRCNLNLWSLKDNYNKEKLDLESLKQKESYASRALLLELENRYNKVQMNRKRYISAEISLGASDSWLKSMAMKYDIDPSQVSGLLKAFEKNIQAKKDYYQTVLDYNLSVSELISQIGLTLNEYDLISQSFYHFCNH